MTASPTTNQQALEQQVFELKQEVQYLNEQLNWFKRQMFGKRSEKVLPAANEKQLTFEGFVELDPEQEPKVQQPVEAHTRKKAKRDGQHKVRVPENLPIERVVIDVPEEEKVCIETGKPLVRIGEEISRKLAFDPARYYIKEIVRPKYAMPGGEGVICADYPSSLMPRCLADESLLAEILVRKFADHSPLYRTEETFARDGIIIPRQVLSNWVLQAGRALEPLADKMLEAILASRNVFIDETEVELLAPGKGKTQKGYLWALAGGRSADPPYRVYRFYENRQHEHAKGLLKGYQGTFHSDKYGAYPAIASQEDVLWCPCWAHIRRKFFEAQSGDPELRTWVLRHIRYLFLLERVAWNRSPEERLRIRQEKEVPIIDKMIEKVKDRLVKGTILPKSTLRQAMGYFTSLIPYLKNYTTDPWARIDNNVAERAIRPIAIGRKNWLFMGSRDGGKATAVICSLVQTCRALNINPRLYLEDVMRRLMEHPFNRLEELLPDQWLAAQREAETSPLVGFR